MRYIYLFTLISFLWICTCLLICSF